MYGRGLAKYSKSEIVNCVLALQSFVFEGMKYCEIFCPKVPTQAELRIAKLNYY